MCIYMCMCVYECVYVYMSVYVYIYIFFPDLFQKCDKLWREEYSMSFSPHYRLYPSSILIL